MKKQALEFFKRGLMAGGGGPVVLAIIYAILGKTGVVTSLTPAEVVTGILTVYLMAFLAAGVGIVYSIERLPLLCATLIHAVTVYIDYLLVYYLNNWVPRDPAGIGIFTGVYVVGYAVVWCIVYLSIRSGTRRINKKLSA